jgi:hypothetical protein
MVSTRTLDNNPNFPGNLVPFNTPFKLSFLERLHFPDLSRFHNNPIFHDLHWPPMPTNFPSDILKFKGKPGEDLGDHMITFHLWCSSNVLRDDSIQFLLFQCTLIRGAAKWYIERDLSRYYYFIDLVMVFLNHFQLPMRYVADTKSSANFEQSKADHILDHIREW